MPKAHSLSVATNEPVRLQCQSACGSLKWQMNGNIISQGQTQQQVVYMANCNGVASCQRNFLYCDEEQAIIDQGPLTSNLTITFDTPGNYFIQCIATLQGDSYSNLGQFKYHSRVTVINVKDQGTVPHCCIMLATIHESENDNSKNYTLMQSM